MDPVDNFGDQPIDSIKKRKPGRPKGAKNKLRGTLDGQRLDEALQDIVHRDPATMVARQLQIIDWMQSAVKLEMKQAEKRRSVEGWLIDIKKIEQLSGALVKAFDAMKKAEGLADELSKRLSAAELLEIAIKKIEGQDLKTITYAIKRLRAHRERVAEKVAPTPNAKGELTAADALAGLDDE